MVRSPCCEKKGLKKGAWTSEEDEILIDYVRNFGHHNWRSLPKEAGLLRCGKSCRLRWMNYLRPDIKRGNFTREEEEIIINLHAELGSKWSEIASKLPGRTDNEIKNIWHTDLKKRLESYDARTAQKRKHTKKIRSETPSSSSTPSSNTSSNDNDKQSSLMTLEDTGYSVNNFSEIDDDFWSENLFSDSSIGVDIYKFEKEMQCDLGDDANRYEIHEDMEFWFDTFTEAGGFQELLDLDEL